MTIERSVALTIPAVTLNMSVLPIGLPMASTHSPTRIWSESPRKAVGRFVSFMRTTAMSLRTSWPTISASYSRPSKRRTNTRRAPSIRC